MNRAATSASSLPSRTSPRWICVTCAPYDEKTWANSAPMNPPPTMPTRSGSASIRITVSLVWCVTVSRPGMSGIQGRVPAAITIWSAVISTPVPCRSCAAR